MQVKDLRKEKSIELYRTMLTIRRFEERAVDDYNAGKIPGIVHSYIGEEAVATGVCTHLRWTTALSRLTAGTGTASPKGPTSTA